MTSIRQIQANRRNALKSSGPNTVEGKLKSRRNAVRHGLTAETVISALEDAEDYKAFEAAIIADYDAQTAVERELVLRLASVLWRLRRATSMETGLFEFEADRVLDSQLAFDTEQQRRRSLYALFAPRRAANTQAVTGEVTSSLEVTDRVERDAGRSADIARCFMRVADLPSYALDRLCRYEAILWRQARQLVLLLDSPGRRTAHKKNWYFPLQSSRPPRFEEEEG